MVFDPNFIARLLPALLQGAVVTVELAVLTMRSAWSGACWWRWRR